MRIRKMDENRIDIHQSDDSINNDSISSELAEQLLQLKTILANSSLNVNEFFCKSTESDETFLMDDVVPYPKSNQSNLYESDFVCKEEDGRISLAYERLPAISKKIADKFSHRTHTLDLSHNNIKDLTFLWNFKILHTLILDNNISLNEKTLPFLPSLRILWLNKCEINHLPKWLHQMNICTPNLKQLSLMGNPGVRSRLNGGSPLENNEYMMYVIGSLPSLEYLDDVRITDEQREMANAHFGLISVNRATINFPEIYSNIVL